MAWNPSDKSTKIALSNNDRTATSIGAGGFSCVRTTATALGTKRYLEIIVNEGSMSPYILLGLANATFSINSYVGQDTNSWSYYEETGAKYTNGTPASYGSAWALNGIVIGLAYDPGTGKVWFSRNNVWQNNGNPVTGTNPAFTGLASNLYAGVSLYRSGAPAHVITGNFVTAHLSYSPPSGFIAWDDAAPISEFIPVFVQTQQPHNSHLIARLGL